MKPTDEERIAGLLIRCDLADKKHEGVGHHITHVHGYKPIFLCGICGEMKQDGILARARQNRKISHYSYFLCSDCMEKARAGRAE